MARLIDAEPILKRWNTESLGRKEMYDMVKNAPTIDAVPVVRCKECKHHQYCCRGSIPVDDNGFCSHGERRKDE